MTHSIEEVVLNYQQNISAKYHPEFAAGCYARDDGTVEFYQRVVAVLPEGATVLDLGAGRGAQFERKNGPWRSWLIRLGKKYARRIGADVDPAVKTNPELDQAEIIEPGKPLPFADQTFDLILCDCVVEHVEDPKSFVAEIRRVLKIGGWLCARTPNGWSYFSIGAKLLSGALENKVLRALAPEQQAFDFYPKFYRLNTLGEIRARFPADQWINATYTYNPSPAYHGNKAWLFHLISFYQALIPRSLGTMILIFARRIT